jgi:hypothetical protein
MKLFLRFSLLALTTLSLILFCIFAPLIRPLFLGLIQAFYLVLLILADWAFAGRRQKYYVGSRFSWRLWWHLLLP